MSILKGKIWKLIRFYLMLDRTQKNFHESVMLMLRHFSQKKKKNKKWKISKLIKFTCTYTTLHITYLKKIWWCFFGMMRYLSKVEIMREKKLLKLLSTISYHFIKKTKWFVYCLYYHLRCYFFSVCICECVIIIMHFFYKQIWEYFHSLD